MRDMAVVGGPETNELRLKMAEFWRGHRNLCGTYPHNLTTMHLFHLIGCPLCQLQQPGASEDSEGSPVLAEVVVHLASTQRRLQRHDPKVTVPQLVSSIGSILGMYVGMSFLLVFSVLDMAARAAFIGARRRHTRSLRWKL
ncbi:uncharacterized protein LOC8050444 isoform X1 [Ixodes scapularis]|uniref:uncharacterized protein LOC8050444 isoform X1 n=1 Tax=Ixodes scapularis TaxID=6945 RepID=UPI001A9DEE66|nr:uncharacterized protein LOC8050444 isoform X1 [Ixodes scapularis]